MAEEAGLSMAEFARRAVLGVQIAPRRAAIDQRALAAVNRVGANLHQLVRALNFKQGIPADISDTLAEVRGAMERLARDGA